MVPLFIPYTEPHNTTRFAAAGAIPYTEPHNRTRFAAAGAIPYVSEGGETASTALNPSS